MTVTFGKKLTAPALIQFTRFQPEDLAWALNGWKLDPATGNRWTSEAWKDGADERGQVLTVLGPAHGRDLPLMILAVPDGVTLERPIETRYKDKVSYDLTPPEHFATLRAALDAIRPPTT